MCSTTASSATAPRSGTAFMPDTLNVTSELTKRFAQAVNDQNACYLDGTRAGDLIAPPMFGIVPAMRLIRQAGSDGRYELQEERMLHGEQDMRFLAPIKPGDVLVTSGWISGINEHSTGSTVDIQIRTDNLAGEEKVRQCATIFIRGTGQRKPSGHHIAELCDPVAEASMEVAADQTHRYARASFTEGIRVHEDEEFARALGFRTMFLQGQCTMAFAAKAIVDSVAEGDPMRLRRLKVRFADQVYPGDVVTTRLFRTDQPQIFSFVSLKSDGSAVLINGIAEIGHFK